MEQSALSSWLTWAFSPAISAIIVTLLVSLSLPILIHTYLYRQAARKELPSFLLLGPSGGGKTALLTLFANSTPSPTHPSQTPLTAICQLPSSTVASEDRYRSEHDTGSRARPRFQLIDTPGHGKLRHHALTSLTTSSALCGLLFVVDSAALSSSTGLTEAAEYLHDVLLSLQRRHTQGKSSKGKGEVGVLLCANKQDVFTSLPADIVKSKLEGEVGNVRANRSKGLSSTVDSGIGMGEDADGDEEAGWLGEYGSKEFRFEQMREHGVEIEVLGGNVTGEGKGVEEWWGWVGQNL